MENSHIDVEEYIADIYAFSLFVSNIEQWVAYSEDISESWNQLEILNASALDEWDSEGRPAHWKKWRDKYQLEAELLSGKILYEIELLIDNKAKEIVSDFGVFSRLVLLIEEDDYLKSKYFDIFNKLENIYLLASCSFEKQSASILSSSENWSLHKEEAFQLVKLFLSLNYHLVVNKLNPA
ncbi:MAG: hypothetical protein Q4A84_09445 [Neisseria sp.]|uniref:hypothetical protein n=1 Tax=Neisseria sp. TaxID=192066 RepID=UPI0026DA7288|nr:hypothetical protein [Neisseria sp.]MDO4641902.1 hypothetical protein [Neisseria sp.]